VLALDLSELLERNGLLPDSVSPTAVTVPILPPAVDSDNAGGGVDPREFIRTNEAMLREPMRFILQPGGTLEQEYTDHLPLRPGPEGQVLLRDSLGNPVLVAGECGQGRVVYTGQIFGVTKRDEQREPEGGEWFLLYHLLRWCAGSGQTP